MSKDPVKKSVAISGVRPVCIM